MIRIVLALALLAFATGLEAGAQPVVEGRILDAEGAPMPVAHIEVYSYYGSRRQRPRVVAASDGRYRIEPGEPGLLRLYFNAPLHEETEVVVRAEADKPVALNVQMQRGWMDNDQSFTRVTTADKRFELDAGTFLKPQPDGSFAATVPAPGDSVVYALPGATSQGFRGWVFDDVTADRFVFVGDEGYHAVVASPGDSVRVTVRPQRLGGEDPPMPVITFSPENRRAEALWRFYGQLRETGQSRITNAIRFRDSGAMETRLDDLRNVMRQEVLALEIDIAREADPFRRELLLLGYLGHTTGLPFWGWPTPYRGGMRRSEALVVPNPALLAQIIETVPPTSAGWAVHPALLQALVEVTDAAPEAVAYVEAVIDEHPVAAVQRLALFNLLDGLYARQGMTPEVAAHAERYQALAGEDAMPTPSQESSSRLTVGSPAPGFGQPPMDRLGPVSTDSLNGKVVLLDFWASDCADCVAEEQALRQAHTVYAEEGFAVVRVVLDFEAPAPDFGEAPWLVYRGEDGFRSRIATAFGVQTLPHRVLLDRDGVILALGDDLLGEALQAQLEQAFER